MSADSGKPSAPGGPNPFSPQDALAFMQKMWNPFGIPMPGFGPPPTADAAGGVPGMPIPNPAAMFAALDPVEIERKIREMRVIENWLAMSINLMQMSIRTLELQKASLEALRSAVAPAPDADPGRP
jgi:hypothetical protein